MVAHAFKTSTQETEAGDLQEIKTVWYTQPVPVPGQEGKTLSQTKQNNYQKKKKYEISYVLNVDYMLKRYFGYLELNNYSNYLNEDEHTGTSL